MRRQRVQRKTQRISQFLKIKNLVLCRIIPRKIISHLYRRRRMLLPPNHPINTLNHDPLEPARKRSRITQLVQTEKRLRESLLHHVLRQMIVLQHTISPRMSVLPKPTHDLGKSIPITVTRIHHQCFKRRFQHKSTRTNTHYVHVILRR